MFSTAINYNKTYKILKYIIQLIVNTTNNFIFLSITYVNITPKIM